MSAQSIYSKAGWPVGWLSDDIIYDLLGEPRAFLAEASVWSYEGARLGAFDGGYLRDPSGDAVGYVEGAHGGPPLPEIQATETLPELQEEPERPEISGGPSDTAGSENWSELAINTLLHGWPPGVAPIQR